jgi:hypothetical protein
MHNNAHVSSEKMTSLEPQKAKSVFSSLSHDKLCKSCQGNGGRDWLNKTQEVGPTAGMKGQ